MLLHLRKTATEQNKQCNPLISDHLPVSVGDRTQHISSRAMHATTRLRYVATPQPTSAASPSPSSRSLPAKRNQNFSYTASVYTFETPGADHGHSTVLTKLHSLTTKPTTSTSPPPPADFRAIPFAFLQFPLRKKELKPQQRCSGSHALTPGAHQGHSTVLTKLRNLTTHLRPSGHPHPPPSQ